MYVGEGVEGLSSTQEDGQVLCLWGRPLQLLMCGSFSEGGFCSDQWFAKKVNALSPRKLPSSCDSHTWKKHRV